MKSVFPAALLLALAALTSGCVEDGQSADCPADLAETLPECAEDEESAECEEAIREELESLGCLTPIGGSCLDEENFKDDRPNTREDEGHGRTYTINDDWYVYQQERPQCAFECMTEEEFRSGRSDERLVELGGTLQTVTLDCDWFHYQDSRDDCFPAGPTTVEPSGCPL